MERNVTETSRAVMASVSVAKAGSSELRSSCLEGAEPLVQYLNTQDMASSQRKNEQLSGNTPSQKKRINSGTSIIASLELEGRETRSSVPSNTPSATATHTLHRESFYPKKLPLRAATRDCTQPRAEQQAQQGSRPSGTRAAAALAQSQPQTGNSTINYLPIPRSEQLKVQRSRCISYIMP